MNFKLEKLCVQRMDHLQEDKTLQLMMHYQGLAVPTISQVEWKNVLVATLQLLWKVMKRNRHLDTKATL